MADEHNPSWFACWHGRAHCRGGAKVKDHSPGTCGVSGTGPKSDSRWSSIVLHDSSSIWVYTSPWESKRTVIMTCFADHCLLALIGSPVPALCPAMD